MVEQVQALFDQSRYTEVAAAFAARAPVTPDEQAWFGISLLRIGKAAQASSVLEQAYRQGHLEAGVELGNAWRGLGDFKGAIKFLTELTPRLSGELLYKALRWRGVAEFQMSHGVDGFDNVKQAYLYYLEAGNLQFATRTAYTLAEMYRVAGRLAQAQHMLDEHAQAMSAHPHFEFDQFTALRRINLSISVLHNQGQFSKVFEYSTSVREELSSHADASIQSFFASQELDVLFYTRNIDQYYQFLLKHEEHFRIEEDIDMSWWTSLSLAEHYSRTGEDHRATALLNVGSEIKSSHLAEWLTVSGLVQYRQGEYETALSNFEAARQSRGLLFNQIMNLRCLLFEADTHRQLGLPWYDQAEDALRAMLASEIGLIHFRADFQELTGFVLAILDDARLMTLLQQLWARGDLPEVQPA